MAGVTRSKSKRFTPLGTTKNKTPSNTGIFSQPQRANPAKGDPHVREVFECATKGHRNTTAKRDSR